MTECGTDVAAYALGSLYDAERRSFERHLATWPRARSVATSSSPLTR
jgi:anti-sigma factor RsiW